MNPQEHYIAHNDLNVACLPIPPPSRGEGNNLNNVRLFASRRISIYAIIVSVMKYLFKALITFYQLALSPFVGTCCRFYPTCSVYTKEAIETHGAFKGLTLGIRRILKCFPWHRGGYDPVPPRAKKMCRHSSCSAISSDKIAKSQNK